VVFTDFFNEKTVKTYKCNRLLGQGGQAAEIHLKDIFFLI
jgi:hypothetical protein